MIIAVTGGDCSGKTDSWRRLPEELKSKIVQVPEMATVLMGVGGILPTLGIDIEVKPETMDRYQDLFQLAQLVSEDSWRMVAAAEQKRLVWCDRGMPDMVAYVDGGWPAVEKAFEMSKQEIFGRYDHVIILRSLAWFDPERFLRIQGENPSRTPRTIEEVCDLDERTREAWEGHPGIVEIDCSRGIDEIVKQIESLVRRLIGKEIEMKFELPEGPPDFEIFKRVVKVDHEQAYLINEHDVEERLRRATYEDGSVEYYYTVKSGGTLSRDEYEPPNYPKNVFDSLWPYVTGGSIEKLRHICLLDGQVYEIDLYRKPGEMVVVEVNFASESEAEAFNPPPWMKGAIDVTEDLRYKAKNIARWGVPSR